jgi:hypothetical protein
MTDKFYEEHPELKSPNPMTDVENTLGFIEVIVRDIQKSLEENVLNLTNPENTIIVLREIKKTLWVIAGVLAFIAWKLH